MLAKSGKLVGLATVRDATAVSYQSQLDEIARGVISAFAEKDHFGGRESAEEDTSRMHGASESLPG